MSGISKDIFCAGFTDCGVGVGRVRGRGRERWGGQALVSSSAACAPSPTVYLDGAGDDAFHMLLAHPLYQVPLGIPCAHHF